MTFKTIFGILHPYIERCEVVVSSNGLVNLQTDDFFKRMTSADNLRFAELLTEPAKMQIAQRDLDEEHCSLLFED